MRALRFHRYGPPQVLVVDDVPEPVPRAGEAKVRVRAVGLNPLDAKVRAGMLRWLPVSGAPPRGLGCDFAGEIAGVGGGATARHVGERVFGSLLPFGRQGALADFITVPCARLLPIAGVDDGVAAALPIAAGTALQALDDEARLAPGQRVLVTGAAGGVGHFAVQIAAYRGAHVTAVCSARNEAFVRALGANDVIDYAQHDFTRPGARPPGGMRGVDDHFDVIFDAASASTFAAARRVLRTRGVYISTLGSSRSMMDTLAASVAARLRSSQRAIPLVLRNAPALWSRVLALAERGVLRPHIERVIALSEVADAQRAMETGHGRGKVIVNLDLR